MSGLLYALLIIPMIGIFFILSFDSYNFNITSNNSNSGSFSEAGAGKNSGGELLKVLVINNELNFYKKIAFITTIMNLIVSLIIYILFDFSTNQFQFVQDDLELSVYNIYLGVDGLSIYFVLLTTIIMPIALISNWNSITHNIKAYLIIILLLETLLLAVFLVLDVLLFYIFFESILPPLFILIGLFGSSNKVRASFYIFLYTLLGSLFLLLSILTMSSLIGTTYLDVLSKSNFEYTTQIFLFLGVFIAFAVKTPTVFLNSWLLKAHVESPLGGSIVLAGIVLKLSLYGIFRLILPLLPKISLNYTSIIFSIGIITIIYASFSTLRTIDIKELIAYSSVSHAAVYLIGVFSNIIQGIEGGILLGLGHGFVSSGLFICAGGVLYDRSGTRIISYYRGTAQVMPLFSILFFILCLGNCGAPLTLNFVGEFMSLYGTFERLPLLGLFSSSSIIFSAAYTIYMYNRIAFGGSFSKFFEENIGDVTKREFFLLFTLIIFTIMFGIYPSFILDGLHYNVTSLLFGV
ncbi:NADH dehydrogenase subunit 4 (mitochondrion) [Podospora bellae-mahoneyi]|uniref:NADH-ubiquinone oxidoreductase chain 4 n=1 Tax=Podospora bellae-mahoneyi TaxID=2093777 RepID=A0ABR0F595_9PEZI|nr:NADH dehydrogenase subunit 4 [Podospora bellae-mahoneyi]